MLIAAAEVVAEALGWLSKVAAGDVSLDATYLRDPGIEAHANSKSSGLPIGGKLIECLAVAIPETM